MIKRSLKDQAFEEAIGLEKQGDGRVQTKDMTNLIHVLGLHRVLNRRLSLDGIGLRRRRRLTTTLLSLLSIHPRIVGTLLIARSTLSALLIPLTILVEGVVGMQRSDRCRGGGCCSWPPIVAGRGVPVGRRCSTRVECSNRSFLCRPLLSTSTLHQKIHLKGTRRDVSYFTGLLVILLVLSWSCFVSL